MHGSHQPDEPRPDREATRPVQHVPTESLVCRPQVRQSTGFTEAEITGLVQSIHEAGGILVPLLVRREGDALIVLDGERRLRAAHKLSLATVPVIVEDRELTAAEVVHRQLVLDAQRVGLSPIERARAIQRLMAETNWTAATVAVKLGLSPANVSKLLTLLILPADVQDHVAGGRIAMSTAYGLATIPDSTVRQKLIDAAMGGRLTRDALNSTAKSLITTRRVPKSKTPRPHRERIVIPLGDGRTVSLSAPRLSVASVADWLGELAERMRIAASGGRGFEEFVKGPAKKAG